MARAKSTSASPQSTATIGFEAKLWLTADKLRNNMDAGEYKHFVLGLIANPLFNDSDWFCKDDDVRWQFGVPPMGNANFAWVQHFIHHLAPHGMAGFVLGKMKRDTAIANSSLN